MIEPRKEDPKPQPPVDEEDEALESGFDRARIRANLRLTPTERLEKHQRALLFALEARRAGQAARDHQ